MTRDLPLPVLGDTSDGVIEVIFGVLVADDQYEAHRGTIEFRGGKLVRVQIGHLPGWQDENGLTVGVAILSTVAGPAATRVYVNGDLESETVHVPDHVITDRL